MSLSTAESRNPLRNLLPPYGGEEISEGGSAVLKSAISALPEPSLM